MIGKILSSKIVSGIAYTIVGSEVVKSSITKENARKVVAATRSAAITTCRTVRIKAGNLKEAVSKRRVEILSARSKEDKLF